MARRAKPTRLQTGLYHAREARGMSRTELVKRSGVSKQQLSRLESGQIRLRLDHLKPFASHLGYTPEQILLWGRYPGTADATQGQPVVQAAGDVQELDLRASQGHRGGRSTDLVKEERWSFPKSFVTEQLHTSAAKLRVLEVDGDSMAPTIMSGDRVVIDGGHRDPSPDGLYAIRDPLASVIVRRLQLLRSSRPPRVKIISENPNHATEEVAISELEIVGKVVCCLKLF
jgi:transcriptional regulator with XRE-family HTH domain